MKNQNTCSRRQFIKIAGAAGLGALTAANAAAAPAPLPDLSAADLKVPTRPFGRSGRAVSILSLGGMFDISANQLMLRQAIQWGVTYWDTADCYQHGSETGIGKYFARYPEDRGKVFLVTKSDARDPDGLSRLLARSLERLQTTYIDLYFVHGISRIGEINAATRRWAEKAKADGKIGLFGFSTHSNMAACLMGAAGLGWLDGIMMTYNFRNMAEDKLKRAVDACAQAGIGLTAMKTQGGRSYFSTQNDDLSHAFKAQGLTEEQAKLKAVWRNPQIASICSQMETMKILKANVEAAVDPSPLSSSGIERLKAHAVRSSAEYCAGCGGICETAAGTGLPIGDVMRWHMYCRSYGHSDWARAQFQAMSPYTRHVMATADYTQAERCCPNKMPIARLMREALEAYGQS